MKARKKSRALRNAQPDSSQSGRSTQPVQPFSLLIKPAGPDCNLRCRYCFYLPKLSLFGTQAAHRMSDEVLEHLVRSYFNTYQPTYVFNWQGGEPTLMGLDFFERVIELQRRYAPDDSRVSNTIQTNATLIDGEWAGFIARNRILTGVSLDGPEDIHNEYRLDAAGHGSFDKVMAGIEHLRSAGAEFNILSMVTATNAERAKEMFAFFTRNKFNHQQYIPCVEFDADGAPRDYTVSPEGWGRFLVDLFHAWYPRKVRRISIRNFDNVVNFLAAGEYSSCTMRGKCDQYFVVEHNGNVYPCDFFVEQEWKLGNIMEDDWSHFLGSPLYHRFGAMKSRWNPACSDCSYLHLCSGDCPKLRFASDRDPQSLSYLCSGHRFFYDQTIAAFTELSQNLQANLRRNQPGFTGEGVLPLQISPEDHCFCGSGKKLKNCHGPTINIGIE